MNQSQNIRVRVNPKYAQLYEDLKPYCGEAHAVFFLGFCLALSSGEAIDSENRLADKFWSGTIKPDEWTCYYALAAQQATYDFTSLSDDQAVIRLAEHYADRGMEILIDELLRGYLLPGDELRLDSRASAELPWELLKFVPDRLI